MYDPTNYIDELNRKTLESLKTLTQKYKEGQIDCNAFKTSLEAIWEVSAGLCSSEIGNLLSDALNAAKRHYEDENGQKFSIHKEIPENSGWRYLFTLPLNGLEITIVDQDTGEVKSRHFSSYEDAKAHFEAYKQFYQKKNGWIVEN